MEKFVTQPLPESPRKARYLKLIEENSGDYCRLDEQWFSRTVNASTHDGRARTSTVGNLAFCYHTPDVYYYKDRQALARLRKAFEGVTSHVADDGRFTWEKNMNDWGYEGEQHEHAWRLEPLLLGYLWIKKDLPEQERRNIETALKRAARWLYEHPKDQHNNRGIVWASVLALCGIYFEEPLWLELACTIGDTVFSSVILPDGEIGEHTEQYAGGGPDINYTYTSLSYLYMYRLWTGDSTLDPRLMKAARWLAGYNTVSQWPVVVGASVRRTRVNADNFRDCLPFFERYSKVDPYFAFLTEKALTKVEGPGESPFLPYRSTHIVSPAIWAILEAGAKVTSRTARWQQNRTEIYSRPNVHYALIGRDYQTGIVFRARSGWNRDGKSLYPGIPAKGMPLRGMQTWAWGEEDPIILHGNGGYYSRHSFTEANEVNTASTDVSEGPDGWEIHLQTASLTGEDSDLATIIERRLSQWTVYAFTPASTVVVYGGPGGKMKSQWYMNPDYLKAHSVDSLHSAVVFEGQKGRIFYINSTPESFIDRVEFISEEGIAVFGLSDDRFRFGPYKPDEKSIRFSDATGEYRLDLAHILSGGNIDKEAPMRLVSDSGG